EIRQRGVRLAEVVRRGIELRRLELRGGQRPRVGRNLDVVERDEPSHLGYPRRVRAHLVQQAHRGLDNNHPAWENASCELPSMPWEAIMRPWQQSPEPCAQRAHGVTRSSLSAANPRFAPRCTSKVTSAASNTCCRSCTRPK